MNYINLHQHSHYSRLDSNVDVETLVKVNKKLGANAVALTDHGNLAGSFELWKHCRNYKVKPILGLEAYYVDDYQNEAAQIPYCYSHIILLAKNETGWNNLKYMQAYAWELGFNRKPRIDFKLLEEHREGIIVTSACTGGFLNSLYLGYDKYYSVKSFKIRKRLAVNRLKKFKKLFGTDLYLEVQLNDVEDYVRANKFIISLGKKYDIPIIVSNDIHYKCKKDAEIHDIIKCVSFNKKLSEENNGTYDTHSLYVVGYDGLVAFKEKWHDDYISDSQLKEWCKNTQKIADCIEEYPIKPEQRTLPSFCKDPDKKLKEICDIGFHNKIINSNQPYYKKMRKNKKIRQAYVARNLYELKVIKELGFSDYYLIVWDIVNRARVLGIPFNMRGSVCGSMAAFCCGISWIDPIRFNCPFERFLTEDRISMPDMDMDFAQSRREEMISYVSEKYGDECVAHIENFSKWKPKGAIKDVCRVLDINFQEANTMTKKIPDAVKIWNDIPMEINGIQNFFDEHEDVEYYAKQLIGLIHGAGVHASGIIITPDLLKKWVPTAYMTVKNSDEKKPVKVTEWDMYALEEMNILKLDFLGLRNLDIVADCISSIISRYDDLPFNDLDTMYEHILGNLDDDKIYGMCRSGNLVGTFQMGTSEGMRDLIVKMVPTDISDIINSIALYRTAVLKAGMHLEYVKRKFGGYHKSIHPKLDEVLKSTKNVMIFQEQCMQTAVTMAGFTPSDSDHFRKGIKLKDPKKFKVWKNKFIKGCMKYSNTDKKKANEIWKFIENFSGYGFCLSHATSYGVFAYITAWLKFYYPIEYMAALLSTSMEDDKKLSIYIAETKRMKIRIKSPEINKSCEKFTISGKEIIYPFTAIKQCGTKAVEVILNERKESEFEDFGDFFNRINKRIVNVGVMVNLILAGCFRKFGPRAKIFDRLMSLRGKDKVFRSLYCEDCKYRYPISLKLSDYESNKASCPSCNGKNISVYNIDGKKFDISYVNLNVFGFTFSDNPLKPYAVMLMTEDCVPISTVEDIEENASLKFGARVVNIKLHRDKNGNEMAFIDVSDGKFNSSITVFASDWNSLKDRVKKGNCYIFVAKKNRGDNFLLNSSVKNNCVILSNKVK